MSAKIMQSRTCQFKVVVFEDASNDSSKDDILGETKRRPEVEYGLIKLNVEMHNSYADIIRTIVHEMAHALDTGRGIHGQQLYASYMAHVAIFKANPPDLDHLGDLGYLKASYSTFAMKPGCNRNAQ